MSSKRKKRRGLVAVGMSLVLALSVAPPVWAAGDHTASSSSMSGDKTFINNETTPYYGDTFSDTELSNQQGTLLTVNNQSSFIVSVPKKISFQSLEETSQNAFENAIVCKQCDLAPTQQLKVSVADVTLHNRTTNGQGSATKSITAYLSDDSETTKEVVLAQASETESLEVVNGSKTSSTGTYVSKPLYLKAESRIHAGVWYGTLNYSIKMTSASQDPATPTGPTWN